MTDSPKRTGKSPGSVDLTGYVFPWKRGQPARIAMAGSSFEYLPCFSTADKLRLFLDKGANGPIAYDSIKLINDGREFLTNFGPEHHKFLKIIVDPHVADNGKIRWIELFPD